MKDSIYLKWVYARPSERGGLQTNKWFLQFMIDIEIIDTNKARVLNAQRFSQTSVWTLKKTIDTIIFLILLFFPQHFSRADFLLPF